MQMAFGLCLVAHIEDENLLGEILEYSGAGSRQAAFGESGHPVAAQ